MGDDGMPGDASEGQDLCNFFASFLDQRQQVERLINWLRESQTACTDTNCFDDINGMPGTEQGGSSLAADQPSYSQDEQGPLALVMCLVFGLLALYAMGLNRDRQQDELDAIKSNRSSGNTDSDNHGPFRRNGDSDDNGRPTI